MVERLVDRLVVLTAGMKAAMMECLKVELTVDQMAVEMVGLKVMMMAGW